MDDIEEENEDKMGDGQTIKSGDGGYTQMRKSEFFNKRLKKDNSATRLNPNSY